MAGPSFDALARPPTAPYSPAATAAPRCPALRDAQVTRYAAAHGGSVTGVHPTPHGLYWLSAGTDDRVRLWDAASYRRAGGRY